MPTFDDEEHTEPWFIDRDGTIIHLFNALSTGFESTVGKICPFPYIAFEQNITEGECDVFDNGGGIENFPSPPCGASVAIGAFNNRLEFTPALPDDFSFSSGSISRFEDRLSLFIEEFTPSRVGEPAIMTGQDNIPTETFITRYDFINVETVGTSDGGQAQIFTPSGDEIKVPTRGTATIDVNGETFVVIDNIQTAGPDDAVFEYDEDTGDILFGNGTLGKIPEDGADIILKISVRNGGGQWEFVGIINNPKPGINIGNVKSVEDKIFYSQAQVCVAAQSGFNTVTIKARTGTLNFFNKTIANQPPARLLLNQHVYARATWGQEILGTGGTITLHKTSGFGYVNPQPAAADPITLIVPPFTTIPFKALEIDTNAVYPSVRATFSDATNGDIAIDLSRIQSVSPPRIFGQSEDIHSGVITTPKNYDDTVILVRPTFGLFYSFTFVNFGTVVDLTTIDFLTWSVSGGAIPIIAPNYQLRLIELADHVGDFDNPVDTAANAGTDGTFSIITGKVIKGSTSGNFDSGLTWVQEGAYKTSVPFPTTQLAGRLVMKWEGRLTDTRKAYLTHIGSPIPPDFICEWKFELTDTGAFFDHPEDIL